MSGFLGTVQQTVVFLLVLSVLVIAHEWGHFIVARIFKIRVDDFSVGFGKRVICLGKLGDTEYNIRAFPLGGFVKIAGMEPDEEPINQAKDAILNRTKDDPDARQVPLVAENIGDGSGASDDPDGFNSKPLYQRSLVILAGPVMSFLTGFIIFCLMGWAFGLPSGKVLNRIAVVDPGGEGHRIGLQAGDYITSINGLVISNGAEMVRNIQNNLNKPIEITVRRGSIEFHRTVTPKEWIDDDTGKPVLFYDVVNAGQLAALGLQPGDRMATVNGKDWDNTIAKVDPGVAFLDKLRQSAGQRISITVLRNMTDTKTLKGIVPATIASGMPVINSHPVGVLHIEPAQLTVRTSLRRSITEGVAYTGLLFEHLWDLIKMHQLQKQTGGVIMVYQETKIAMIDGAGVVFNLAAQVSISLAIFNLLPIPVLDGGHLLAFFIEWTRRGRKMTPQLQQAFNMAGISIIGVLFVLIMGHDIWNWMTGHVPQ